MNPTTPMIVTAVVLLFHQLDESNIKPQPWIALVGLWLLLGFLVGPLGDLAALVAWLIAIGMVYTNGKQILDLVETATDPGKKGKRNGKR